MRLFCYCLIVSAFCVVLFGCAPKSAPPSTNSSSNRDRTSDSATEENSANRIPEGQFGAENLTITKRDIATGKMLWEIKAKKGNGQAKDGTVIGTLEEVQGMLYRDGEPALRFEADYVKADSDQKRVVAWGSVKAISKMNKAELTAQKITWESKKELITAEGSVRIKAGDFEMFDDRLHADTALQRAWRDD